jgi:hypothetical protein
MADILLTVIPKSEEAKLIYLKKKGCCQILEYLVKQYLTAGLIMGISCISCLSFAVAVRLLRLVYGCPYRAFHYDKRNIRILGYVDCI